MARVVLALALAVVLAAAMPVLAYEEAPQASSFMEVGARSSISAEAARPLQGVAELLVAAQDNLARLSASRKPFNVISNHIRVRRSTNIRLPEPAPAAKKEHVNAELVPQMQQPTIHDPEQFGTKYPISQGTEYVEAAIVGEDGQPYAPRKQWEGITDPNPVFRSPFARFIQPPKVGSAADVVNKDPNTKLTAVEQQTVNNLQLRLKRLLDQLGANIVWDNTKVANRRLLAEFEAIKQESRAMMEEYELRTGVKTIAWQLGENDIQGLTTPRGAVTDIHFSKQPELAGRKLQRKGDRRYPLPLNDEELRSLREEHGLDASGKPINAANVKKEQLVNVAWKQGEDGVVKAKVNLQVIKSKVPDPDLPPAAHARETVEGKLYPSGRRGSQSKAVEINVVAPLNESLKRNGNRAAPVPKKTETATPAAPSVQVNDAPKINL